MRVSHSIGVWLGLAALLLAGCQQATSPDPAATTAAPTKSTQSIRPSGDGPEVVVYDFLEAVRTGNDTKTAQMLTPTARQKVAEHHMSVAPPGSDTARFVLGGVERLNDQAAHVTVHWTDLDETGKPRTDEVVWMMRKVEEGWRVAGVAAPVFDGEPPLLLNFEDPQDMMRKQQMVRQAERGSLSPEGQPVQGQAATVETSIAPTNTAPATNQDSNRAASTPTANELRR